MALDKSLGVSKKTNTLQQLPLARSCLQVECKYLAYLGFPGFRVHRLLVFISLPRLDGLCQLGHLETPRKCSQPPSKHLFVNVCRFVPDTLSESFFIHVTSGLQWEP